MSIPTAVMVYFNALPPDVANGSDRVSSEARQAVRRLLADPRHRELLRHIRATLGLSRSAIETACVRYAVSSMSTGNEIYADPGTHVAMWLEYQTADSLHVRRQAAVLEQLERHLPMRIADLGFGAPTRYLRDYVLPRPAVTAHLFDKFPAALDVGHAILSHGWPSYRERIELSLHDMDADVPISGFDGYLLLDAIEHASSPTSYLEQTVRSAREQALFLLHVPIGPLIPSHSIAWDSESAATRWLMRAGLEILQTEVMRPNPAVDHFAKGDVSLEDLFVVARKAPA